MVQSCRATPGCVAYIGISAQDSAIADGLGEAQLQNKAGTFVQPSPATVSSAVTAGSANVPEDLAASLIYEPGAQSYPIVNFEYILVKSNQSNADLEKAIGTFLTFAIDTNGGDSPSYLAKEQSQPLPTTVVPKVENGIAKITG